MRVLAEWIGLVECSAPPFPLQVFKMLGNKESLDQIIVATPGLSSDPIALGKHRRKWELLDKEKPGEGNYHLVQNHRSCWGRRDTKTHSLYPALGERSVPPRNHGLPNVRNET